MRDHIIETAGALFYKEGVRAVGVDRVVAEAGIAKATLYRHFPTKEDLIVAYLQSRNERVLEGMRHALDQPSASARDLVRILFRVIEQKADSDEFRGCAFMLAVAEQEGAEAIRTVAIAHKDALLELFATTFRGRVSDSKGFARDIALLYDGALATILLRRDGQAARLASRLACKLLDDA